MRSPRELVSNTHIPISNSDVIETVEFIAANNTDSCKRSRGRKIKFFHHKWKCHFCANLIAICKTRWILVDQLTI